MAFPAGHCSAELDLPKASHRGTIGMGGDTDNKEMVMWVMVMVMVMYADLNPGSSFFKLLSLLLIVQRILRESMFR